MGLLFSKLLFLFNFSKSPDVYTKELEGLNKEIVEVTQKKKVLEHQYSLTTQFILSYSRLFYFILILVFFFSAYPSTFIECVFFWGPVAVFYLLVSVLKKSLKWLYDHEMKQNEEKVAKLQHRKKSVLNEVKKRVVYKQAKNIISKYSYLQEPYELSNKENIPSPAKRKSRFLSVDNFARYVFDEEKENALICKYCNHHNGLALREEMDSISFRCCCCYQLNQAKKVPYSSVINT